MNELNQSASVRAPYKGVLAVGAYIEEETHHRVRYTDNRQMCIFFCAFVYHGRNKDDIGESLQLRCV